MQRVCTRMVPLPVDCNDNSASQMVKEYIYDRDFLHQMPSEQEREPSLAYIESVELYC